MQHLSARQTNAFFNLPSQVIVPQNFRAIFLLSTVLGRRRGLRPPQAAAVSSKAGSADAAALLESSRCRRRSRLSILTIR